MLMPDHSNISINESTAPGTSLVYKQQTPITQIHIRVSTNVLHVRKPLLHRRVAHA